MTYYSEEDAIDPFHYYPRDPSHFHYLQERLDEAERQLRESPFYRVNPRAW